MWIKMVLNQLTCDGCRCEAFGPARPSRAEAAQEAVLSGWISTGRPLSRESKWYCPECQAGLAPAKNHDRRRTR